MSDFYRIKHSFNCGDLICIIPGLLRIYRDTGKKAKIYQRLNLDAFYYHNQVNSTVNTEGNSVCMNEELFNMLKPLIELQQCVESFEIWKGEDVDLDYDLTRDTKSIPMPAGLLHVYSESVFPQTSTDLSLQWLFPGYDKELAEKYKNKVLINRTQRYTNPYNTFYFLKPYESHIIFSGTKKEHEEFCKAWELDLEYVEVRDFRQLALIIQSCKFGIYNQSLHFHIADATKSTRILELCGAFPNTFVTGANGYQFYRQAALEYYVNKLIQ